MRKQKTIFNGFTSSEGYIADGVPYGSVLGPTLFLCYINDLLDQNLECDVGLYADATVLYLSESSINKIVDQLNHSLKILHSWCVDNRLTINTGKTKTMLFAYGKMLEIAKTEVLTYALTLHNTELEFLEKYDYLGVTLDCELNFVAHLNKMRSICSQKIFPGMFCI